MFLVVLHGALRPAGALSLAGRDAGVVLLRDEVLLLVHPAVVPGALTPSEHRLALVAVPVLQQGQVAGRLVAGRLGTVVAHPPLPLVAGCLLGTRHRLIQAPHAGYQADQDVGDAVVRLRDTQSI